MTVGTYIGSCEDFKKRLHLSASQVMDQLNRNPLLLEPPIYDGVHYFCTEPVDSLTLLQRQMQQTTDVLIQYHAKTHLEFEKQLVAQQAATQRVIESWTSADNKHFRQTHNFKQRHMKEPIAFYCRQLQHANWQTLANRQRIWLPKPKSPKWQ